MLAPSPSSGRAARPAAELSQAHAAGCGGGPGDGHLHGEDFTASQALAEDAGRLHGHRWVGGALRKTDIWACRGVSCSQKGGQGGLL